ncbi:MAG: oligosaccharide flippase family protein [bacterium]
MNLKVLSKHILIYTLGVGVFQIINLVTTKFYTNFFTLEEFGEISLIIAFATLLSTAISGIQISNGLGRFYSDNKYRKFKKIIISTSYFSLLIFSFISYGLISIFSKSLKTQVFSDSRPVYFIFLVIIFSFVLTHERFFNLIFKWDLKPKKFIVFSNINPLLTILGVIFFTLILKMRLGGFLFAVIISSLLTSILILFKIKNHFEWSYSWKWAKKIISYSLPLIPYASTLLVLTYSDRFLVKIFMGFEYAGLYSLGAKISGILTVLSTGFRNAWGPYFFSTHYDKNASGRYSQVFDTFVFLSMLGIVTLTIFANEIILVLSTAEYLPSHPVIPFLLLSNLLFNLQFFMLGIYIKNKTYYLTITALISVFINISLDIWLIPLLGIIGAALATMVSYIIMFVTNMIISQKLHHIPYKFKKNLYFIMPWFIFCIFFNYYPLVPFKSILIKIILVFLFLTTAHITGIINGSKLKKSLKNFINP